MRRANALKPISEPVASILVCLDMQTMYLVLVEKSGAEDGLSSIEIMFYNSFLSLPFLLFLIIATGEFPNSLTILFAKVRFLPRNAYLFPVLDVLASKN